VRKGTSLSVDVLIVEDLAQQKLPARCAAAVLQREGLGVRLVDLNDGLEAIVAVARTELPRLVISSLFFADRVDEHLALMTALRREGLRAHLALMGHLPTCDPAGFLGACSALDSVLRGDAEIWAPQLAHCVLGAGDWQAVPGIAPRLFDAHPLPLLRSGTLLDYYPEPLREQPPLFRGYPFATIESSRGCYHACSFCLPAASYRAQGVPYRMRPIAKVVEEIEFLYRTGVRLFLFDDDEFLPTVPARAERIGEFSAELDRRDLHIAFTIKCRADDVESASFRRLKEIGLLRVYLGVESGCQATLDLLDKHTTVQQNQEALATLHALGIVVDFRSLLFHPWSTLETISTDLGFLQAVLPRCSTLLDVREVQAYPGTPLARRLCLERGSPASHGLISYTIADPRAEFLRRIGRMVFDVSEPLRQARRQATEEWYALLLTRRFQSESYAAKNAQELTRTVTRLNAAILQVWRAMLAYARAGDIHDPASFDALAADGAFEINAACGRANL
jgi:anaerobic magnesium-protoporphyrin IX monomethyl ester cyclase